MSFYFPTACKSTSPSSNTEALPIQVHSLSHEPYTSTLIQSLRCKNVKASVYFTVFIVRLTEHNQNEYCDTNSWIYRVKALRL
jgi:hypothetical protein